MMIKSTLVALATLFLTAHGAAIEERKDSKPWPGKCTIGINHQNIDVPGGNPVSGAGANTHLQNSYAFIVGSDGHETRFPVSEDDHGMMSGSGNYGGTSGGNFQVSAQDPQAANVAGCTVAFTGRKDHADQTLVYGQASKAECDLYVKAGAFNANTGCRCRFDCQ